MISENPEESLERSLGLWQLTAIGYSCRHSVINRIES